MNKKADDLGLKETYFLDPTGLNPENRSSARDLVSLMQKALEYPLLSEIMKTKEIDIASADDKFHHHLANTDMLLGEIPEIIGGKTGYTEEAGNCMVLAVTSPNGEGTVISVVMNAKDRIAETKRLITWTKTAFFW
jgi:D-alanyl-D-alanine endopeptidase (penicillin-binding protein 7)